MSETIRLNSYISRCGVCSRRQADNYILDGRVKVNSIIIKTLGTKIVIGEDTIAVDNKIIYPPKETSYYVFNKPAGVVTTMDDPQNRPSIKKYVKDIGISLFPVGRLDFDSEGLLILTNDGELSHRIQHPRYQIEKTYIVETDKILTEQQLAHIFKGVMLDDGFLKVLTIRALGKSARFGKYRVVIHEGRKRIIRRLFEKFDRKVTKLKRISIGNIHLEKNPPGSWRKMSKKEISLLKKIVALT
ncbi:MAG: rRNA pseudouridine synthase [candidate division Zixibacteria bacterium]|nr:rRNA pseudouridine synthase [candidate division Zixibacteria bacterium]